MSASCGSATVTLADVLAAVATAWALDVPPYLMQTALVTFDIDELPATPGATPGNAG